MKKLLSRLCFHSRTFLSLEVSVDGTSLMEYISAVDTCFREFNLPGFYQVGYTSRVFSSSILCLTVSCAQYDYNYIRPLM